MVPVSVLLVRIYAYYSDAYFVVLLLEFWRPPVDPRSMVHTRTIFGLRNTMYTVDSIEYKSRLMIIIHTGKRGSMIISDAETHR